MPCMLASLHALHAGHLNPLQLHADQLLTCLMLSDAEWYDAKSSFNWSDSDPERLTVLDELTGW